MGNHTIDAAPRTELRKALEALPGVHRVLIDDAPAGVLLVCDPPGGYPPIEGAARALLQREGMVLGASTLRVSYLGGPLRRRRVRFDGLEHRTPAPGQLGVTASLEWNDRVYRGSAEGERGLAADLRVVANATLHALEAVLEGVTSFHLVGVKSTRIFDDEMVAVLVYAADRPDRRLVGTALVTEEVDSHHAAARAVLHATNRCMGNYLVAVD